MVVTAKRKAYIKLKRYHTKFHLLDYRNKRDISKRTLLYVKKEPWEHFCSQLTYKTNSRILWQQIKIFNGKPFKHSSLVVYNIRYSESRQKAEILILLTNTLRSAAMKRIVSRPNGGKLRRKHE